MSRHADALHATISDAFHMHDEGNKGLSNNFQYSWRSGALLELKYLVWRAIFFRAGFLDRTDFKCAFIFLIGVKPSKSEVETMLKHAGISVPTAPSSNSRSGSGEIEGAHDQPPLAFSLTLDQFTAVVLPYVRRRTADDDIKDMFDALDAQHCGFVSRADFRVAAATVRATETPQRAALSASAVDRAFTDVDSKGYGRVSLRQFGLLVRERQQTAAALPTHQ